MWQSCCVIDLLPSPGTATPCSRHCLCSPEFLGLDALLWVLIFQDMDEWNLIHDLLFTLRSNPPLNPECIFFFTFLLLDFSDHKKVDSYFPLYYAVRCISFIFSAPEKLTRSIPLAYSVVASLISLQYLSRLEFYSCLCDFWINLFLLYYIKSLKGSGSRWILFASVTLWPNIVPDTWRVLKNNHRIDG